MKQLGNITYIKYELENPKFNCEIKDVNQLNIITGTNGSGKTLHLTLFWCINTLVDAYFRYKFKSEEAYRIMCENIFKYIFKDLELDGQITAKYEDDLEFNIVFTEGIVMGVNVNHKDGLRVNSESVFLSKETRQFNFITRYFQIKEMLYGKDPIKFKDFYSPNSYLLKLLEMYRVHDILYMEKFISTFISKKGIPSDISKLIDNFEYKFMYYDSTDKVFYLEDEKGIKKNTESLSSGEQALLIMFMSTKYL